MKTKYAVSQNVARNILTVKFSDGSAKYYDALDVAIQWMKMTNDEFFRAYGFNFNPHEWGNLYDMARKALYMSGI